MLHSEVLGVLRDEGVEVLACRDALFEVCGELDLGCLFLFAQLLGLVGSGRGIDLGIALGVGDVLRGGEDEDVLVVVVVLFVVRVKLGVGDLHYSVVAEEVGLESGELRFREIDLTQDVDVRAVGREGGVEGGFAARRGDLLVDLLVDGVDFVL